MLSLWARIMKRGLFIKIFSDATLVVKKRHATMTDPVTARETLMVNTVTGADPAPSDLTVPTSMAAPLATAPGPPKTAKR